MKLLFSICLTFSLVLLCSMASNAQRTTSQNFIQLQINGKAIDIDNLSITDALGPDNKMTHSASFDMAINDLDITKAILTTFQSSSREKNNLQLSFTTFNFNEVVQEEKTYSNVTIQEIVIPAFDGSSRTLLKATVKLKAASVQLQKGGSKIPTQAGSKKNATFLSNYRLTLGSLPANRISKISSLSILPGNNQLQNFTLEVSAADAVKWNQWFLTGAGGIKKEQGTIEILAPNMMTALVTIQLTDVEIVSFSTNTSNQQSGKGIVGLRVRNVMFK